MKQVIGFGAILSLILLIGFTYTSIARKDPIKPWWSGTAKQKVCDYPKHDYCYTLDVTSDGNTITRVTFPTGGYNKPRDVVCKDTSCTFWNSDSLAWQVEKL